MRFAAIILLSFLGLASCQELAAFDSPRETGQQCADGVDNDGTTISTHEPARVQLP